MDRQPYIDRFGILHVPWLAGQPMSFWDRYHFEATRKSPAEFWRSVDRPRRDGKCFSPRGWLTAAMRRWEQSGGLGIDNPVIESRATDPQELANHYWTLQDKNCWRAYDAYERGWKPHQWAKNLFKRFGIDNVAVKDRILSRAEDQWLEWARGDNLLIATT